MEEWPDDEVGVRLPVDSELFQRSEPMCRLAPSKMDRKIWSALWSDQLAARRRHALTTVTDRNTP